MRNTFLNDGRIASGFRELRARREGALVAYLTGGDPDPKSFLTCAAGLVKGGADILEVGIPFSDPIADGPVIQASSQRALLSGTTPAGVLGLARELSREHDIPIVVLTYHNPILAMGLEKFLKTAQQSGVNGIVVPDLPIEESNHFTEIAQKRHIDTIFLAAPNTSKSRLVEIVRKSRGFLYLVSLFGVTGPRKTLSPLALESLKRVKSLAGERIPVAAGFGISRPDHVTTLLESGADGAIVGSALVEVVAEHLDDSDTASSLLKRKVSELKKATRRVA